MPNSDVRSVSHTTFVDNSQSVMFPSVDPVAAWGTTARVVGDEWAASGSGCSVIAHGIEQRIADVIFDGVLNGAYGRRWDLVVLGAPPAPGGDFEHDVVLPAQAPRRVRVLQGAVHRVSRPWPGLALSEADIESVIVGEGDA